MDKLPQNPTKKQLHLFEKELAVIRMAAQREDVYVALVAAASKNPVRWGWAADVATKQRQAEHVMYKEAMAALKLWEL